MFPKAGAVAVFGLALAVPLSAVASRVAAGTAPGEITFSSVGKPQLYTDEIELDELKAALDAAYFAREGQASPDWTTLDRSTLKFPRNRLMEAAGTKRAKIG